MTKEMSELILCEEGFKIKETNELVDVLGGENELYYSGFLHNKKENNVELSRAKEQIIWAISTNYYEFKEKYNGFLITGIKKDIDCIENISKEEEYGIVFYQALKFTKK